MWLVVWRAESEARPGRECKGREGRREARDDRGREGERKKEMVCTLTEKKMNKI